MARKKRNKKIVKKITKKSYFEREYKKLLLIPGILLLLSLLVIGVKVVNTGEFINKGVSLKGGITLTILSDGVNSNAVDNFLISKFPDAEFSVRSVSELGRVTGVIVETGDVDEEPLVNALKEKIPDLKDNYSVETIGASLSESFFQSMIKALFVTFMLMAYVVFLYFGEGNKIKSLVGITTFIGAIIILFSNSIMGLIIGIIIGLISIIFSSIKSIPSAAVVLAAFSDIIITLAVVDILNIKLSTAGIAAFLMLIGYSVDTDILLSTRVLKNSEGSVYSRVIGAMKTGLVMNLTTTAAVVISLIFSQSEVIKQIMTILFIGLLADLVNTWLQNAGIIRWHLEK